MLSQIRKYFVRLFCAIAISSMILGGQATIPAQAAGPNYAKSTEIAQFVYSGYIQFKPNYKTTRSSGYHLNAGKHVRQAYINYTRNGKSVIGGRKYTANVRSGSRIVSTSARAYDDLRWGDRYTTKFHYGWYYR